MSDQPNPPGHDPRQDPAGRPPGEPPPWAAQPPYGAVGQPPFGQPGSHPYGGPGQYGGPYIPPIPKQGGALKWVLLGVGLVLLLTCGGCVAVIAVLATGTGSVVERQADDYDGPGSAGDPLTVGEGEAFDIGGLDFADGWSVTRSRGDAGIDGLRVTNNRSQFASVDLDLSFSRAGRPVGEIVCTATAAAGESADLLCYSAEKVRKFDEIAVEEAF